MLSKDSLKGKMAEMGIEGKDIEESFITSSGPGGQNVNKVSSCVFLYHRPTGISVKCQTERSQSLNRLKARWLLLEKIERKRRWERMKEIERFEKLRRQKRRRSKEGKEKMLEEKRRCSEKKAQRKKMDFNRYNE